MAPKFVFFCLFFTSSSDSTKQFNQHWSLKASAYGGIKFTSRKDVQQELLHSPSVFSIQSLRDMYAAAAASGFSLSE